MYRANRRAEDLEITSGQVLLEPLIRLAQRKGEIWMAGLHIEAGPRPAQMDLCSRLLVLETL